MAIEKNFNWTPRQMARVNARREARGQEAYVNTKFENPDYANRYEKELGTLKSKGFGTSKQTPSTMPLPAEGEEPELSLKDRLAKNAEDLNKFTTTGPATAKAENTPLSLKERMEDRTKKFKEKFAPTGTMGIERGVKNSASSVMKKGIGGGVGTSMQNSFNQMIA